MISTRLKTLILALLALGLFTLFTAGCNEATAPDRLTYGVDDDPVDPVDDPGDPEPLTGTAVGQRAPDFTLDDSDGATHTLSQYRGQPVVLYFWASYCSYCAQENPHIQSMQDQYGEDLVVLSVNLGDSPQVIQAYLTEHQLSFPALVSDTAVQTQYRIYSVPHSLVLDAEGIVQLNDHPALIPDNLIAQLTAPEE